MLAAGQRLGPYEIVAPLGAGGMGEVYRARDTRLGREVAIKVLPQSVAADAERLRRFAHEAQLLAALNHSNIAALYGVEETNGTPALVMELVPGETLAERIAHGPLPADEAIPIARQIAEALEYAHERNIIHRDLKPANVKLLPDGAIRVLDFGLAKALAAEGGASSILSSPTMTAAATQMGVILGTAAYMSPEQAKGKAVDRRSDIWSFGCVLYEMLTGKLAFGGETVTDTLAAVVRGEPEWSALPAQTPASVRRLLERCLRKEVKARLQAVGDARIALEEAFVAEASAPAPAAVVPPPRRAMLVAALALVAVVGAALGAWGWRRFQPRVVPTRLVVTLPQGQVLAGPPAVSRDGRTIAYVAREADGVARLYVRPLDRYEATVIPNSESAMQPFFSPEGGRIGFFARGKLLTAAIAGGPPTAIADTDFLPFGGTWGDDDTIVFVSTLNSGLLRIPAAGGKPQRLTAPDDAAAGYAHVWPQFLPGNRSVLFTIWGGQNLDASGPAVFRLDTGTWSHFGASYTWSSRYAGSGHLLASSPHGVSAMPFDGQRPPATQARTFVLDDVFASVNLSNSWFDVSDTGTLVYVPGDATLVTPAWVDRKGVVTPILEKPLSVADPALSPDGTQLVLTQEMSLWRLDLRRGTMTRQTFDNEGGNMIPIWNRDGTRIIFGSNRAGDWDIYSIPASGGPATRILARKGTQFPLSFAPDGTLLFSERTQTTRADLWMLSPDGTPRPFVVSAASKVSGQYSPNGSMVAYVSDETGRNEIYVRSTAQPDDVALVSSDGGNEPMWSHDGKELYYRRGSALFAARITNAPLAVSRPVKLFDANAATGQVTNKSGYGVAPDGRFLMLRLEPQAVPTHINVVLNWFEELKAKVPPR